MKAAGWDPSSPTAHDFPMDPTTGLKTIPHWLAQPNVRPPKPQDFAPAPGAKLKERLEAHKAKAEPDSGASTPTILSEPIILPTATVAVATHDAADDASDAALIQAMEPEVGEKRQGSPGLSDSRLSDGDRVVKKVCSGVAAGST